MVPGMKASASADAGHRRTGAQGTAAGRRRTGGRRAGVKRADRGTVQEGTPGAAALLGGVAGSGRTTGPQGSPLQKGKNRGITSTAVARRRMESGAPTRKKSPNRYPPGPKMKVFVW